MDTNKLVCPISLEEIQVAGITCVGSIYDYDQITKWLEDHDTDPLTNLHLVTKMVVRQEADIVQKAKEIKESTMTWCQGYRTVFETPALYARLLALKQNTKIDEWDEYSRTKAEQLDNYENGIVVRNLGRLPANLDKEDTVPRPHKTGARFQFVTVENKIITNKIMKYELFDFAVLNNVKFVDCNLSRARFVGTTFNNVVFHRVTFIGEETSFYKAVGTLVTFIDCNMEYVEKWESTCDPAEMRKIVVQRGLTMTHVIV